MSTNSSETAPSAPTRYISPRRAERQRERALQREMVAAELKYGFGRANRRHPAPVFDMPNEDEDIVLVDILLDKANKRSSAFKTQCVDCGPIDDATTRRQALDQCHQHLQQKHPGVKGRIRKDVT